MKEPPSSQLKPQSQLADNKRQASAPKPRERLKKAEKETGSRAREAEVIAPDAPIESILNCLEARREAVETLYACLKAERTYYDVFSKQMVVEPDYATRCSSAKTLLAYDVGEPVKRQQIVVTNVDSMDDLKAKLATNPALRAGLQKILDESKAKAGQSAQ